MALSSHTTLNGPHQVKKYLKCPDSDHPVHAQCLTQAFTLHSYILKYPIILLGDSKGPDQTAQMCSLIWVFTVHMCSKTCFPMAWPKSGPEVIKLFSCSILQSMEFVLHINLKLLTIPNTFLLNMKKVL